MNSDGASPVVIHLSSALTMSWSGSSLMRRARCAADMGKARPAGAMAHAGQREEAEETVGRGLAIARDDAVVEIHIHHRGDHRIGPALEEDELAAARLEAVEVQLLVINLGKA